MLTFFDTLNNKELITEQLGSCQIRPPDFIGDDRWRAPMKAPQASHMSTRARPRPSTLGSPFEVQHLLQSHQRIAERLHALDANVPGVIDLKLLEHAEALKHPATPLG